MVKQQEREPTGAKLNLAEIRLGRQAETKMSDVWNSVMRERV